MPPEDDLRALEAQSLRLWQELDQAYDAIEAALVAAEPPVLETLAARIVTLETELGPIMSRLRGERSQRGSGSTELRAMREQSEELIRSLVKRHPVILAAAIAARDGVSERAAQTRALRDGGRRYREPAAAAPRFTSQRA